MRWLSWFRREEDTPDPREPLDVDQLLAEVRHDQSSAHLAIEQFKRERTYLLHQQRAVDKQFKRLTTGNVRNMGRAGPTLIGFA